MWFTPIHTTAECGSPLSTALHNLVHPYPHQVLHNVVHPYPHHCIMRFTPIQPLQNVVHPYPHHCRMWFTPIQPLQNVVHPYPTITECGSPLSTPLQNVVHPYPHIIIYCPSTPDKTRVDFMRAMMPTSAPPLKAFHGLGLSVCVWIRYTCLHHLTKL